MGISQGLVSYLGFYVVVEASVFSGLVLIQGIDVGLRGKVQGLVWG